MTKDEALKMALEAIEYVHDTGDTQTFDMCYAKPALAAIKEALAQPEQEPVAWMDEDGDVLSASVVSGKGLRNIPLYTTPPQRTWVGLTEEEMMDAIYAPVTPMERGRRVEAKLRSKNTKEQE